MAMPTPWPTGTSGPASRIWPGKRAWNHCDIQPLCGVYRCVVVVFMFMLLFDDYPIKVGPHIGDLLEPLRLVWSLPVIVPSCVGKLSENQFRVTDYGNLCRHTESDPRRRSVSLNIARGFTPSGCLAELLAAPEPKADRQYSVGAPGERFLPWTSDCQRVVLRHGALPAAPGINRYLGELNEFA